MQSWQILPNLRTFGGPGVHLSSACTMFDLIKDIFGVARDAKGILRDMRDEKKKARGMKNAILSEIEFNATLIFDHYLRRNVSSVKIVRALKSEHLTKAIDSGFDLSKIKKGKITREIVGSSKFFRNHVGYDCEALLKNIRLHTEHIKILPELYHLKTTRRINVRRRLINLGARYVLLMKFLKS